MNQIPLLQVRVVRFDGTPAADVRFSFRPVDGAEYRSLQGSYEPNSGVYTFVLEDFEPGMYMLRIEAPEYDVIEKRVEFRDAGYSGEVFLVEEGVECVKIAGQRVYFRRRPELIRVHLGELFNLEDIKQRLEELDLPEVRSKYIRGESFIIESAPISKADRGVFNGIKEKLRSQFRGAIVNDQAIEVVGGSVEFLSDMIMVEFNNNGSWDELERTIGQEDCRISCHETSIPLYYIVEVESRIPYMVLEVHYKLLSSPLVRSSELQLEQHQSLMGKVLPGDLLRPWQWHLNILRLPEAWGALKDLNEDLKYGSPDLVLAVHDGGIATKQESQDSDKIIIPHPEFSGTVNGGSLTTYLGTGHDKKVYYCYDFSPAPGSAMVKNNNVSKGQHGLSVAGVATAPSDGKTGIVGTAPGVRLASYIMPGLEINPNLVHFYLFMAGMDPEWRPASLYHSSQDFPSSFRTGGNAGPGAGVINCSHSYSSGADAGFCEALRRVTLLGRNRRGTVILAASGNSDDDTRPESKWGSDLNVLKVAASSLNHKGIEVLAPFSSHATLIDPGIDFCAPSSSNLGGNHRPRMFYSIVTATLVNIGNVPGRNEMETEVLSISYNNPSDPNDPPILKLSPAGFLAFSTGGWLIVKDAFDNELMELNKVIGFNPINKTITLDLPLRNDYYINPRLIGHKGFADFRQDFGGTSAATPMVSGIVALMLSANPQLTWAEARQILRDTAVPIAPRYSGPVGKREKRWVNEANDDVTTPHGDLIIPDGAITRTLTKPLFQGASIIDVGNTDGFLPRQIISIGAESGLLAPISLGSNVYHITVRRPDHFEVGDSIFVGKVYETVTYEGSDNYAGNNFPCIYIADPDGFAKSDFLEIIDKGVTQVIEVYSIEYESVGLGMAISKSRVQIVLNPTTVGGVPFKPVGQGAVVRIGGRSCEGPFIIEHKVGNTLKLDKPVVGSHPSGRMVQKENTELAVIKRIVSPTDLELYFPLAASHPLDNIPKKLHISGGLKAVYSYGFGYGRVDAYEAVKAAIGYTHNARDLMIRNFLADDGVNNRHLLPVESPDLWVVNGKPTTEGSVPYSQPGPHQNPRMNISAPIFIGSGLNDLSAAGNYIGSETVTYIIEIVSLGDPSANTTDRFTWRVEGGKLSDPRIIGGAQQPVDNGFDVIFNAKTGHTIGDRWYIRCEPLTERSLHVRVHNRGTEASFARSKFTGRTTPVCQSRILLCLSDGSPVVQYYAEPKASGVNDLRALTDYTGTTRDIITVKISSVGASDSFIWSKGNKPFSNPIPITGTSQTVGDSIDGQVEIKFNSATGHAVGDAWVLKCYPDAHKFINIDHYIEKNPATGVFDISSNQPGTWLVAENELSALAAGASTFHSSNWQESKRPPRNGPGVAQPSRPLRMFLLGEVIPHDGKLMGDIPQQDNNFSYREIIFARFGFKKGTLVEEIAAYIEADSFGGVAAEPFAVQVIVDAGTFRAQSVKLELVATFNDGTTEKRIFEFNSGFPTLWGFADAAPSWCTMKGAPKMADGATDALDEQYYMTFSGTLNATSKLKEIRITPKIYSAIQQDVVLAEESKVVAVHEAAQLASGRYNGISPADLAPRSHFFTDPVPGLQQTPAMAYGPVAGDEQNKFRVTSLFKSTSDVNAYAVVDSILMIQRVADPASPDTYLPDVVNLVLKPYRQAMLGFTPVKYFIYRNLRLDEFLKGNSGGAEALVRDKTGASPLMQKLWELHKAQNPDNPNPVPFESIALGFDPSGQPKQTTIDTAFHREDPDKQLPFVSAGTNLGKFHTNSGADHFGFEIILDEGEFQPSFEEVRRYNENVIDLSELSSATPEQEFTIRLEREKILNYIDPAAFFGMHMAKDGWLQTDNGGGDKTKHVGEAIYTNVISKFHTRNTLYIDIRNENDLSLNFYGEYDDGSGNALEVGDSDTPPAPQPYRTHGWPLIIRTLAPMATDTPYDTVLLRLRRAYDEKRVLYLEHGEPAGPTTRGRFIADEDLFASQEDITRDLGFRFPAVKGEGDNERIGAAWMLKLHYGLRQNSDMQFPAGVVPTASYLDNLFGPVDIGLPWKSQHPVIAWMPVQDKKYVDGEGGAELGFEHMADRGVIFSQWKDDADTGGTVLFYAAAKDSFFNGTKKFVPHNGITGGISRRSSIFDEAMLFNGYTVGYDVIVDSGAEIRTMQLQEVPPDPRPAEAMMLLGLTTDELKTKLKGIQGFDDRYPRTVVLEEVPGSPFTNAQGGTYRKYKAGVQGLTAAGLPYRAMSALFIYSTDRKFFFSAAFSAAQPVPSTYQRNYEEAFGAQIRMGATYPIKSVNGNKITVTAADLRREIVVDDMVRIKNTDYKVTKVEYASSSTEITVAGNPGATPGTDTLRGPNKSWEDYFIARDTLLAGNSMGKLVKDFITGVQGIPDTSAAPGSIQNLINTAGPAIFARARLICSARNNNDYIYADDRILYWARIKMMVALKSHPHLLKVLSQRNRLVKLLDAKSRGYETASFSNITGHKVLVTGYDPFQLASNIKRSNPSGAAALALHGQTFEENGIKIHVQAAIFPVRYADFDQNPSANAGTGVVENFFGPFLDPTGVAAKPDIIVTLSQGGAFEFWVDRFASRTRGGYEDNLNVGNIPFPATVTGKQFYESTLPADKIVPANNTGGGGIFKVYYNNIFEYLWDDGKTSKQASYLPAVQADNTKLKIENPAHPDHNKLTGPVPTALTSGTKPKDSDITAVRGSGGSYLSNEIFYRVARLRELHNQVVGNPGAIRTGHYHVPLIQHHAGGPPKPSKANPAVKTTEDFNPEMVSKVIREIIASLIRAVS